MRDLSQRDVGVASIAGADFFCTRSREQQYNRSQPYGDCPFQILFPFKSKQRYVTLVSQLAGNAQSEQLFVQA